MKPMFRTMLAAAALLAVTGCASQQGMYDWGGYSGLLYQNYKKPDTVAANLVKLQEHVSVMEQRRATVAPGLYADLGTLYLQAGDRDRALDNYRKERAAWPESAGLMDSMIKNLAKPAQEAKS
jgi:hypothetical protein